MSEQKLPPAWAVFTGIGFLTDIWRTEQAAASRAADLVSDCPENGCDASAVRVVELIPREDAERMVADAVAAERERCGRAIDSAEDAVKSWGWLHDDKYRAVRELLMAIRAEIREVTE
jgi:hypothetical protein